MNQLIILSLSFLLVSQLTIEAEILGTNTYRYQARNDYFRSDLNDGLSQHHQSISSLQKRMEDFQLRFNAVDTAKISRLPITSKNIYQSPETIIPEASVQKAVPFQPESQFESTSHSKSQIGFYILPFIALQNPGDFAYKSPLGELEIDHDIGFSTGWRVGIEGTHLFLDTEFSYIRNQFKSLQNVALRFEGEAEGFSFLINTGAKIKISERVNFILGGGFGGMNQEIGFDLSSNLKEEESTLFSYQVFTGINFAMAEHLRVGLRYRWMRVGEMEFFTARDLHLAELSLGYVF